MARKYDMAVFIGRFHPFHLGHKAVIEQGLEQADHVVVLVGSARSPRSYRNPFLFTERKDMIKGAFSSDLRERIIVLPLEDMSYNDDKWTANVQAQVEQGAWYAGIADQVTGKVNPTAKIALIGHKKDNSSYYLKLFPQWKSIEVDNFRKINGTHIRSAYFSNIGHMWVKDADGHIPGDLDRDAIVPTNVKYFLEQFIDTPDYKLVREELEFITKYKLQWASAPYAPTFVTVDAVVVQSGHVLLVRRGAQPGKGLWAMPGGFINADEKIRDAAIRELREETGIKVPEPVLYGSIVTQGVFDDPNRSGRGRTITHAFLLKLRNDVSLPKVKGMDDADKAKWVQISQLQPEDFFEDHYHIIMNMIDRIPPEEV